MDFSAFPPLAALLDGAHALLTGFAGLLDPVAGSAAAALAIVLVTLAVRAALVPLGVRQVRAEFERRRLAPHLAELQRRYKKNPELLQKKSMELYQREGVSPFAGILPALAQLPVVSLLYGVAVSPTLNGHPNDLLLESLGAAPLGGSLPAALGAGSGRRRSCRSRSCSRSASPRGSPVGSRCGSRRPRPPGRRHPRRCSG